MCDNCSDDCEKGCDDCKCDSGGCGCGCGGEDKLYVSWHHFDLMTQYLMEQIKYEKFDHIVAVARGGLPLGTVLSHRLGIPLSVITIKSYDDSTDKQGTLMSNITTEELAKWSGNVLVCDDLADTGHTLLHLTNKIEGAVAIGGCKDLNVVKFATLFYKPQSVVCPDFFVDTTTSWVVFPWEKQN